MKCYPILTKEKFMMKEVNKPSRRVDLVEVVDSHLLWIYLVNKY